MTATQPSDLQHSGPFAGYDDEQHHPLGSYAALMGAWGGLMTGFLVWAKRSGHELPERPDPRDLALTAVAAHKLTRLIGKDRITETVRAPFTTYQESSGHGEVEEAARGRGLRRAIGELILCPNCLGLWATGALGAGMVAAPRTTRFLAGVLSTHAASDALQLAYAGAKDQV